MLNFANATFEAAKSASAESSTMTGHLPPNSRMQGIKFLAAVSATSLPFYVDPVKHIRSHGYLPISAATSGPPSITAKQSLSKYFSTSFFTIELAHGAISDGLITARFPEAIA